MFYKILMSLLIIACSLSAPAQTTARKGAGGHGGDGVIHLDPKHLTDPFIDSKNLTGVKIDKVESFDFFEAAETRNLKISLGAPKLHFLFKAKLALRQLRNLDPIAYKRLNKRVDEFMSEAAFPSRSEIPDIDDSHELLKNIRCQDHLCFKVQFAVQYEPQRKLDKRYLIDGNFWRIADNDHKTGLLLHEIVYRDAIELGHIDSDGVRYFVSALGAGLVGKMTPIEYVEFMKEAKLHLDCDFSNKPICEKSPLFSVKTKKGIYFLRNLTVENGEIISGKLLDPIPIQVLGHKIMITGHGQSWDGSQLHYDLDNTSPQPIVIEGQHLFLNGSSMRVDKPLRYSTQLSGTLKFGPYEFEIADNYGDRSFTVQGFDGAMAIKVTKDTIIVLDVGGRKEAFNMPPQLYGEITMLHFHDDGTFSVLVYSRTRGSCFRLTLNKDGSLPQNWLRPTKARLENGACNFHTNENWSKE